MNKIVIIFIFLITSSVFSIIYEIKKLDNTDNNFIKFKNEIQDNNNKIRKIRESFSYEALKEIKKITVASYKVKKKDTIFSIAEKFGMSVDTLISFNEINSEDSLKESEIILIPNMDGIVIFPEKKLYIKSLADLYKIREEILFHINNIQREFLYPKEEIFIPLARMSDEEKSYFLAKVFIYPLKTNKKITSLYGMRRDPFTRRLSFHGGVDIATPIGTNVMATADGEVIHAGWGEGYGVLVVLKHKYGYTSWYGHLSRILVKKGDIIKQGQIIAISGNTGRTTGPHLHFEIRRFNTRKNPFEVLDFTHP